jgi:hypothetical protein
MALASSDTSTRDFVCAVSVQQPPSGVPSPRNFSQDEQFDRSSEILMPMLQQRAASASKEHLVILTINHRTLTDVTFLSWRRLRRGKENQTKKPLTRQLCSAERSRFGARITFNLRYRAHINWCVIDGLAYRSKHAETVITFAPDR